MSRSFSTAIWVSVLGVASFDAGAQMLAPAASDGAAAVYEKVRSDAPQKAADKNAATTKNAATKQRLSPEAQAAAIAASKKTQTLQELDAKIVNGSIQMNRPALRPTVDGSERGDAGLIRVLKKGEKRNPNEDDRFIFLYYSNFRMTKNYSTGTGCNVRFTLLSNLDRRLNNLSVKLVWPDLTTSISFNDVEPNINTYFDYALFGKGCYNMDKIPNIVVNRCRVKGMTQEECSRRIRWLSHSKK